MPVNLANLFSFFSVVLHAGALVFQSMLLGGTVFVLWIARAPQGVRSANIFRIQAFSWKLLCISAVGLAAVQLLYLYMNSAVLMATTEIGFGGVVGADFFVWGAITLGASLVTSSVARAKSGVAKSALPGLAFVIVCASVMTTHAASRIDGRPLLLTLSFVHAVSTGAWIGGLPFLVLGLYSVKDSTTRWYVAERFSLVALISVAALVVSGAVMSMFYVGSWAAALGTAYGVMLMAKVLMLGTLLLLGGVNFLLLRRFPRSDALPRLRRLIEAEVGIGITTILTAASMTSQPPAVDLRVDTVTFAQICQRFEPKAPRLTYKYVAPASTAAQSTNPPGEGNGTITPKNIDGIPLSTTWINGLIESESNHHWMGLVVLAMGLFALLARTGRAPLAKYWPLLLIGAAVFIFLRADTECWPVGWKGFWACWADPEVFQHRVAAIVCLAFGAFEARVHSKRKEGDPQALVFPLMSALGGAVLLTHSHAITNLKENALTELSHVPMGVIAVFAGWARWLELRLPENDRRVPSWIWPACFVLIGLALLNYREM